MKIPFAAAGLLLIFTAVARGAMVSDNSSGDNYLLGYSTATLNIQYHLHPQIEVKNGVVTVDTSTIPSSEITAVRNSLMEIPGVRQVVLQNTMSTTSEAGLVPASAAEKPPAATGTALPQEYQIGFTQLSTSASPYVLPTGVFPAGRLFDPLMADPKWPGFSAAYEHYAPGHFLGWKDVAQVSIGDTIPFYRGNLPDQFQWETGLQADVYAFFNLDSPSADLQNADYLVGAYGSVRRDNLSLMVRFFHQSSHLGDNLLINEPEYISLRQTVSYEEINAIGSVDLMQKLFRLYGGVGILIAPDPSSLGLWSFEYGAEFNGPPLTHMQGFVINPVAGADFQNWSANNYNTDISLRAGIQFTNGTPESSRFQVLLEYFHGNSYNGQFYVVPIQYIGFGVHFYF
ncbi:MAG TPA: DUF1207 domain-containing protein [Phycisphaerae bacterium]|nr:DUF1207 domain-containing protein [Phycisphaerae bacterium]